MSFRPATPDDEAALLVLFPEGEISDSSQLPSSIPACFINVIPELKVEGQVVKSGSSMNLGKDFTYHFNSSFVGCGTIPKQYTLPAGSFVSVAVVAGNVSAKFLTELQTRISNSNASIE